MSFFKKGDRHEIEKSIKSIEIKCRDIKAFMENKYNNLEESIDTKYSNLEESIDTKYSNLEESINIKYSNLEESINTKYSNLEKSIETKYSNLEKSIENKCNEMEVNILNSLDEKFNEIIRLFIKDNEMNIKDTVIRSQKTDDYFKKLESQLLNIHETISKNIMSNVEQAPLINVLNNMSQNLTNLLVQIHNDLKSDLKSNFKNNETCDEQCIKQLISESNEDLLSNMSTQSNKYLNHVIDVNNQLTKNIKDLEQVILNVDKNINTFYFENELIKNQLHLAEEISKWSDEVNTIRDLAVKTKQSVDEILNSYDFDIHLTSLNPPSQR